MATEDDLTAERADLKEIARKLVLQINEITPAQWDKQDDKDQAIIIAALQTARQEALREGRDYALACVHERATQLDGFIGSSEMAGVIRGKQSEAQRIADALDRLASEGG